ncbi:MAG: hypothetical protein P0Y66_14890 [Candidatus Kaistia colombiensis]|nr:MAG: hypothetical protein P0Y66_14890 [Kaistia sp.]
MSPLNRFIATASAWRVTLLTFFVIFLLYIARSALLSPSLLQSVGVWSGLAIVVLPIVYVIMIRRNTSKFAEAVAFTPNVYVEAAGQPVVAQPAIAAAPKKKRSKLLWLIPAGALLFLVNSFNNANIKALAESIVEENLPAGSKYELSRVSVPLFNLLNSETEITAYVKEKSDDSIASIPMKIQGMCLGNCAAVYSKFRFQALTMD